MLEAVVGCDNAPYVPELGSPTHAPNLATSCLHHGVSRPRGRQQPPSARLDQWHARDSWGGYRGWQARARSTTPTSESSSVEHTTTQQHTRSPNTQTCFPANATPQPHSSATPNTGARTPVVCCYPACSPARQPHHMQASCRAASTSRALSWSRTVAAAGRRPQTREAGGKPYEPAAERQGHQPCVWANADEATLETPIGQLRTARPGRRRPEEASAASPTPQPPPDGARDPAKVRPVLGPLRACRPSTRLPCASRRPGQSHVFRAPCMRVADDARLDPRCAQHYRRRRRRGGGGEAGPLNMTPRKSKALALRAPVGLPR